MQSVNAFSTASPYAASTNTNRRTTASPSINRQQGPGFGVIDGGCCSGPCAVGCSGLLAVFGLFLLRKPIGRVWRGITGSIKKAFNVLAKEVK